MYSKTLLVIEHYVDYTNELLLMVSILNITFLLWTGIRNFRSKQKPEKSTLNTNVSISLLN